MLTPLKGHNDYPGTAAGLVLMEEKQTFIRLQLNTIDNGTETLTRLQFSLFKDEGVHAFEYLREWDAGPEIYLRLGRTGDMLFAAFSKDGRQWQHQQPEKWRLPAKLKLGVFAASTSKEPFKPRFDRFKLTRKGQ